MAGGDKWEMKDAKGTFAFETILVKGTGVKAFALYAAGPVSIPKYCQK